MADRKKPDDDYLRVAANYLAELEEEKEPREEAVRVLRRRDDGLFDTFRREGGATSSDPDGVSSEVAEQMRNRGGYRVVPDEEFERAKHNGPVRAPKGTTPFIRDVARHPTPEGYNPKLPEGPGRDIAAAASLGRGFRGEEPTPTPAPATKPSGPRRTIAAGMPAAREGGVDVRAEALRGPLNLERTRQQSPLVADYLASRPADDELGAARSQANADLFGTRLARAGTMVAGAFGGIGHDREAWNDLETSARQPVADLQLRRQMGREDAAERRAGAAEGRAVSEEGRRAAGERRQADVYDPGSERSRAARALLLTRFPDRATRIPQGELARMSAADVYQLVEGFGQDAGRDDANARHKDDVRLRGWAISEQRADRAARKTERKEDKAEAARIRAQERQDRENEKDMAELEKRTNQLAQTKGDVETINRLISEGGDIPGAGVWDSAKMENGLLRALFASKEDHESWQASQRMSASYLNTMTGQSFTPLEAERTLARYGVRPGATEQEWRSGMTAFIRDVKSGAIRKEAPFKQVVPEFRARGGVTAQDLPDPAPSPTQKFRQNKRTGEVQVQMSDGSWRPYGTP